MTGWRFGVPTSPTSSQIPTLHASTSISLTVSLRSHPSSPDPIIAPTHLAYILNEAPSWPSTLTIQQMLSNWEVYSKLTSQNLPIAPSLTSQRRTETPNKTLNPLMQDPKLSSKPHWTWRSPLHFSQWTTYTRNKRTDQPALRTPADKNWLTLLNLAPTCVTQHASGAYLNPINGKRDEIPPNQPKTIFSKTLILNKDVAKVFQTDHLAIHLCYSNLVLQRLIIISETRNCVWNGCIIKLYPTSSYQSEFSTITFTILSWR